MYNMTNFSRLGLRPEFVEGVTGFIYAKTLEPFQRSGMVKCPCNKCQCMNYEKPDIVELHLYRNGFKKDYTVWSSHGEIDNSFDVFQHYVVGESSSSTVKSNTQNYRMDEMIQDAYGVHSDFEFANHVEEALNAECKKFFEQLEVASRPLYLKSCKFCGKPHYKRAPRGKKVVKPMHYLPLIPRLKRLYASNSSAPCLRWHHENKRPAGVMCHPSNGEAWKHVHRIYPQFAVEPRFKQMSEIGKKARASTKGGSLHTSGLRVKKL